MRINKDIALVLTTITTQSAAILYFSMGDTGLYPDEFVIDAPGDEEDLESDCENLQADIMQIWHDSGQTVYLYFEMALSGTLAARVENNNKKIPPRWYRVTAKYN